jgi:ATP-dependent RNA helicase RhlE
MSFEKLGLMPKLLKSVTTQGYTIPTPIQEKAIPVILKGRDVLGGAQTGTGKTAAFAFPVLQLLNRKKKKQRLPRVLVLTPTRELASQVHESFETYGQNLSLRSTVIYGGVNINPQIKRLKHGVDVLVACPGRLLDHAARKTVNLSGVEILILDEADRMLDMGFIHDIRKVLKLLPAERQNLMFSATYSREIKELAGTVLRDPEMIEVAGENAAAETVRQVVHPVSQTRKRHMLTHLIKDGNWSRVLVFTRTKYGANRLTNQLIKAEINAAAIHGNKSQAARTRALADFKNKDVRVLVATDIAARGLDIDKLPHVVNFELPNVPEDYIHRIGRTGRAGSSGEAVSLVTREEQKYLVAIDRLLGTRIPVREISGFDVDFSLDTQDGPEHRRGTRRSKRRSGKSTQNSGFRQRRRRRQKNGSKQAG